MLNPNQPNKVSKCGWKKPSQISVFVVKVPFTYEFLTAISEFMQPRPLIIQLCKYLLDLYARA